MIYGVFSGCVQVLEQAAAIAQLRQNSCSPAPTLMHSPALESSQPVVVATTEAVPGAPHEAEVVAKDESAVALIDNS